MTPVVANRDGRTMIDAHPHDSPPIERDHFGQPLNLGCRYVMSNDTPIAPGAVLALDRDIRLSLHTPK